MWDERSHYCCEGICVPQATQRGCLILTGYGPRLGVGFGLGLGLGAMFVMGHAGGSGGQHGFKANPWFHTPERSGPSFIWEKFYLPT
jgi:hypothetical protein